MNWLWHLTLASPIRRLLCRVKIGVESCHLGERLFSTVEDQQYSGGYDQYCGGYHYYYGGYHRFCEGISDNTDDIILLLNTSLQYCIDVPHGDHLGLGKLVWINSIWSSALLRRELRNWSGHY